MSTYSFTHSEVQLLCEALHTALDVDCPPVIKRQYGKDYWRIYISGAKSNREKVINLVIPFFHVTMLYKLGNIPNPS